MRFVRVVRDRARASRALLLVASALPAACAGGLDGAAPGAALLTGAPSGSLARIEVQRSDTRPRLTLVTRDGDPVPAVAAVVVTRLGSGLTTALSAVTESRLRAAGFDVDMRVDRDAFRARLLVPDAARLRPFFAALASAARTPVAAGSAETALAAQRLAALRRHPLDAPELGPIAACTGALGLAPGEAVPDVASEAGARSVEEARRSALEAGAMAVAAVGPVAFTRAAAKALAGSSGWPTGAGIAEDGGPAGDSVGVYVSPGLDQRSARISVAVRVGDPSLAAAAAERLGEPDGALLSRLRMLPEPWRAVQIAGAARSAGGCVGVTIETSEISAGHAFEEPAAIAAAIARREITGALAAGGAGAIAGRQILTATDPREAASRAAWWSMAGGGPVEPRWATALGAPPSDRGPREASASADAAKFRAELERALAMTSGAERRLTVERGQGEMWMLLASPCGVAEEGARDAGLGGLAVLAAIEAERRAGGVTLEPWISADGIGVVAHAPFRDERETPSGLARRVADAASRALTAAAPSAVSLATARAAALDHLERVAGYQGVALDALAPAIAPDHPSWVEPFGSFRRVVEATGEGVRARARALAAGPLRLAVIANGDAGQAAVAADAVDRWLSPASAPRVCRAGSASAAHAGHVDLHLPDGAPLAQGLVGAALPLAPRHGPYAYRDLAAITAAALEGPGGLLASALALAGATATARIAGGSRAPTLIVDVRAPSENLAAAVSDVKALLVRLPTAASDADLARAASIVDRRERDAARDPRRRLVDLWSGRGPVTAPPSLSGWRAFLAAALREPALIVVEAKPR